MKRGAASLREANLWTGGLWTRALWAGALAASTIAGAGPVLAAPPKADPGRAAVVQAISDCRKLGDGAARLACYDKAADAFDQAQAQGQVVVVDREQVRTVRRQSFGFNIPSIAIFTHGPKEASIDSLTVQLASARTSADGKWILVTGEDAVWRQTDSEPLGEDPHKGSQLAIRRGALGSYFCRVDGQPAIRCERSN